MTKPEPAIDVAKRMCDPFLSSECVERLFIEIKELLLPEGEHPEEDNTDIWRIDADILSILTTTVDTIRTEWQSQQKRYEGSSSSFRCSATATVVMITPGVMQLSVACQGTTGQLQKGEIASRTFNAIVKAVEEGVTDLNQKMKEAKDVAGERNMDNQV